MGPSHQQPAVKPQNAGEPALLPAAPDNPRSGQVHILTEGWMVEAWLPGPNGSYQQHLFVAALPNCQSAVAAVRQMLGAHFGNIETKCRFSSRALMRLGMKSGQVKRLR